MIFPCDPSRQRAVPRRRPPSPRYGYYVDHLVDAIALGYGRIGPTEVRLVLIALNAALALGLGLDFNLIDIDMTVFDLIGLGIAAVMVVLLVGRAARNLRLLARDEPAAPRG